MKNFVAASVLAAMASAGQNQQIEHMWITSPDYEWYNTMYAGVETPENPYGYNLECANDNPEWECLMKPLLLASARAVVLVENEWTAEKRKELLELNIALEVAKQAHRSAVAMLGEARCGHEREVAMRALYACEIAALRTYTSEATAYPASWVEWLREQENCVHLYNATVADMCLEAVYY